MARQKMFYNKLLGMLSVGFGFAWALENITIYEFDFGKGILDQSYGGVFSNNGSSQVQLRDAVLMNGTVVYDSNGAWDSSALEEWLQGQKKVSIEKIFENIGPSAVYPSISPGVVIASPSQTHPDYFYQWIRDSALTINSIVSHSAGPAIETLLQYLNVSFHLQRSNNTLGAGIGYTNDTVALGDPKWNVDNTAFTEDWGRPQNDGPALQSIAILKIIDYIKQSGTDLGAKYPFQSTADIFDDIVRWDLRFIIDHWNSSGFDLWEEVNGMHFFTLLVQLSAVDKSLSYFNASERSSPFVEELRQTRRDISKFLVDPANGFINGKYNYIVGTPMIADTLRSGLDISTLLAANTVHDAPSASHLPFDINDPAVLNTLHHLMLHMRSIYPINDSSKNATGIALGRYPEDVYDGYGFGEGNPWVLATCAASTTLYQLIYRHISEQHDLVVPMNNDCSNAFWSELVFSNLTTLGNDEGYLILEFNTPAFNQTIQKIFQLADSFLVKLKAHVGTDGELSEQFNKYTGFMQGAQHLTWSYTSFWDAYQIRQEVLQSL
ncbi:AQG_2a_G0026680.mRNA.1.CDS.1 [Saccharomyces cerevisiae]|nr:Sga1p [Saccharomyces cerevisiae YJM451]AJR53076.1 Sga1p [Saccharomyces cerevisiae YJM1549]CAI4389958.1 AIG_G0026420.mRNA.1.CDS.1 [Saccharomyces cerevisiae]CAI4393768.1 AQG_2a_G0026680.mRNA.1.CDS.1 [Saccharomyces cerevisiae]CAI4401793.1 ACH_G0026580.mRNA.1.CDS.1 [Saccharomyces cerevisiae]